MKQLRPHWKSSDFTKELCETVNKLIEKIEDIEYEIKELQDKIK